MKIYKHIPNYLVRLQIIKQGEETKYLTLSETSPAEVEAMVRQIIGSQNIDPFVNGRKTTVNIREAVGGDNGKSKSISFYGLSTEQTLQLIKEPLEKW